MSVFSQLLKGLFRKAGLEVSRVQGGGRAKMGQGLESLHRLGLDIQTILDVGASNGAWSIDCMRIFPEKNYVLYEPQPIHAEALARFGQQQHNVTIVKKAIGDRVGETYFDASDPVGGVLLESSDQEGAIAVEMTTIDTSVTEIGVEGPYLLKLDTHGVEKAILDGASSVLEDCSALIIESYNYRITKDALLFWEICAYLGERGFRPIDLVDVLHRPFDGSLWQMDLFFIQSTWPGFDYVEYR